MSDGLGLMLTVFSVTLLLGLAFGVLVKVLVASELERWFGARPASGDIGAPEGDARNFRIRPADDDHIWEDVHVGK